MKLSTGKVAFPVEFENGDKAIIFFNPNDRRIQERINNFEKSINEKIKEINIEKYKSNFDDKFDLSINFDNPDDLLKLNAEEIAELKKRMEAVTSIDAEYNEVVKKELDVVFDSKVSDVLFRYCQPFDSIIVDEENGTEIYIMHVLKWLMNEIKLYGNKTSKAREKYTKKYNI